MRVCIPCLSPGGPEGILSPSFRDAEILDYYECSDDGSCEHTAQMRTCGGASCVDPLEAVIRRHVEVVAVRSISRSDSWALGKAGVAVLICGESAADCLSMVSSRNTDADRANAHD